MALYAPWTDRPDDKEDRRIKVYSATGRGRGGHQMAYLWADPECVSHLRRGEDGEAAWGTITVTPTQVYLNLTTTGQDPS